MALREPLCNAQIWIPFSFGIQTLTSQPKVTLSCSCFPVFFLISFSGQEVSLELLWKQDFIMNSTTGTKCMTEWGSVIFSWQFSWFDFLNAKKEQNANLSCPTACWICHQAAFIYKCMIEIHCLLMMLFWLVEGQTIHFKSNFYNFRNNRSLTN